MAVFLLILKILLIVLLSLIAAVLLLLFLPAMAIVEYKQERLSVRLRVLYFIKIKLPIGSQRKAAKKKADQTEEQATTGHTKKGRLDFELIKQLLPPAGILLKKICAAISITDLYALIPVHAADPARTALAYGRTWAAIGVAYPLIENTFKTSVKNIEVTADYSGESNAKAECSFEVHAVLGLIVIAALSFLLSYLKIKNSDREEQNGKRNR